MTAWLTVSPRYASASRFSFISVRALISCAVYFLPSISVVQLVPMWRLTERIVRSGFVIAWRLATSPTRTSPVLEKATTDGVVREPSALGMTTGSPASRVETTELVVPRSIPTALAMMDCLRVVGDGMRWDRHALRRDVSAGVWKTLSVTISSLVSAVLFPGYVESHGPSSGRKTGPRGNIRAWPVTTPPP